MPKWKPDDRVQVAINSGINSERTGTVVERSAVKTDGRGTPTNVPGAYKPVNWKIETAIKLDCGELITMYNDRIRHA